MCQEDVVYYSEILYSESWFYKVQQYHLQYDTLFPTSPCSQAAVSIQSPLNLFKNALYLLFFLIQLLHPNLIAL